MSIETESSDTESSDTESSDTESSDTELTLTEVPQCGCGAVDEDVPELDARQIPHAIRHGAIFGALAMIRPGRAMVLVAPHDPLPLLAQIADREGEAVAVSYLQRGPEAWRLLLSRRA